MSEPYPQLSPEHTKQRNCNNQAHEQPVISHRWKWVTVLGNAAIGAWELVVGGGSTLTVTADGLHNVGDALTYKIQADNLLQPQLNHQQRQQRRKVAHWIIATTSAAIGVKAGVDIPLGTEHEPNAVAAYAASASLALNGVMLALLKKRRAQLGGSPNVDEHDLLKHFWAVDIPSAALALTGAVLQKYNVEAEQAAAVLSGALGVYTFRPTKKNLVHNCLHSL